MSSCQCSPSLRMSRPSSGMPRWIAAIPSAACCGLSSAPPVATASSEERAASTGTQPVSKPPAAATEWQCLCGSHHVQAGAVCGRHRPLHRVHAQHGLEAGVACRHGSALAAAGDASFACHSCKGCDGVLPAGGVAAAAPPEALVRRCSAALRSACACARRNACAPCMAVSQAAPHTHAWPSSKCGCRRRVATGGVPELQAGAPDGPGRVRGCRRGERAQQRAPWWTMRHARAHAAWPRWPPRHPRLPCTA
jgi:hypothetical protein